MVRSGFLAALLLAGCATNPYTHRKQLLLIDEATEKQLGLQSYQEALAKAKVSSRAEEVEPLRRVGHRIAAAAARPDYAWEFNVIEDPKTVNAWCMPGGKIAFYSGIYPVLEDEAAMAFVMGHEVSHALLRHGGERISQGEIAGAAEGLISLALSGRNPRTQKMVLAAFGAGAQVGVLLPFSREQEAEADRVGLQLMAKAGYDPHAAVELWKRMQSMSPNEPSQFLSDHPSHESRIQDMESHLPDALAIFQSNSAAPVAKLPAIDKKAAGPAAPGLGRGQGLLFQPAGVNVKALGMGMEQGQNGRTHPVFHFSFDRDAFIETMEVTKPAGAACTLTVHSGVIAGQKYAAALNVPQKGGRIEASLYELTFTGAASGRPFSTSCSYSIE